MAALDTMAEATNMAKPKKRPRVAGTGIPNAGNIVRAVILAAALLLFFVPLVASAAFGFSLPGRGFTLEPLTDALAGTDFAPQVATTLQLAALSTLGSLVLLVPTLLFLHLRAPHVLKLTEWLSVIPYVVPAIALVGGANLFFRAVAPGFLVSVYSLVPFYMVLTLPLVYRSLDAGIRAMDVRTLFAASASLGATPLQTLWRIIIPNMRASLLGAALLSCAMVLGEYALASLLLHSTFPVFMVQIGMSQPRAAAALSFLTILATWLLLASLSGATAGQGRGRGRDNSKKKTTSKGGSR